MEDLIKRISENVVSLEPGNPTFRDVRYTPVSLDNFYYVEKILHKMCIDTILIYKLHALTDSKDEIVF